MAGQNRKYTITVRKITKYCIVNISKFTTNECLQYLSDLKLKFLLDRRSLRAKLKIRRKTRRKSFLKSFVIISQYSAVVVVYIYINTNKKTFFLILISTKLITSRDTEKLSINSFFCQLVNLQLEKRLSGIKAFLKRSRLHFIDINANKS